MAQAAAGDRPFALETMRYLPATGRPPLPLLERLWAQIDSSDPEGCWPWQGQCRGPAGHGRLRLPGRGSPMVYAHRLVYELRFGPIPRGLVVRHRCDRAGCCNPDHLELGTPSENFADWWQRGRFR